MLRRVLPTLVACVLFGYGAAASQDPGTTSTLEVDSKPAVVLTGPSDAGAMHLELVAGTLRLSDQRFVVADSFSRLTLYGPEGQWLSRIGPPGPELGSITSLQRGPADSLYVFDQRWQQLNVYSGEGHYVRSAAVEDMGRTLLSSVSYLADDVWVGRESEAFPRLASPYDILRDTVAVVLMDPSLRIPHPLTNLAGRMWTTNLIAGRRTHRFPPFSPRAIVSAWGRCVFTSATEGPVISIFSAEGELVSEFSGPGQLRAVTREHIDSRLAHVLSQVTPQEAPIRRRVFLEEAGPRHLPYYNQLVVDQWGTIWLEEFSPPEGLSRRWSRVSQTGAYLGAVVLPKPMTVFSIAQDGILGRIVTPSGDETVELLPWSVAAPHVVDQTVSECQPDAHPRGG